MNAVTVAGRAFKRASSAAFIVAILASRFCVLGEESQPPADLVRRVARAESEAQGARDHYTYRQTVTLEELDNRGGRAGEYREIRDIIFSPTGERTEQMAGSPFSNLKRLIMTDEDFRDIRDIQPFVFNEELRPLYETKFRGEEKMDDMDCWVLQIRPRQILQNQRLFDGLLWVAKSDFSVVRSEGQAVPQIRSLKSENLFPRFTTIRRVVDGRHRFPVHTFADDMLPFRTGPIRIRMNIRYANYKRFGAESSVIFQEQK